MSVGGSLNLVFKKNTDKRTNQDSKPKIIIASGHGSELFKISVPTNTSGSTALGLTLSDGPRGLYPLHPPPVNNLSSL